MPASNRPPTQGTRRRAHCRKKPRRTGSAARPHPKRAGDPHRTGHAAPRGCPQHQDRVQRALRTNRGKQDQGRKLRSRSKGIGSYQGWVTSALTQPRLPIVGTGRNPSRETALTEPARPAPATRRRPRTPPHQPPAATRRAKRAPSPPPARTPPATRTTPGAWHGKRNPGHPARRTLAPKPSPAPSQAQPTETPGQDTQASQDSQARVRNPRPEKRTLTHKQV